MANISTRQYEIPTVQIKCTESGKIITAELVRTTKAGIEFTCYTK